MKKYTTGYLNYKEHILVEVGPYGMITACGLIIRHNPPRSETPTCRPCIELEG